MKHTSNGIAQIVRLIMAMGIVFFSGLVLLYVSHTLGRISEQVNNLSYSQAGDLNSAEVMRK